ncbi:hypothetical protein [Nocardioides piscis]|uniref:Uncharacterized protein n=1 Tax=Nocardioides piscis TaxID=2714938 RepID=A0A6G7YFN8_9ACTN|nr:hypothetical protein [Nocardioides piscis]QIK75714.1 hypothetical protein G7071_09915 [Nocardioides piscis]
MKSRPYAALALATLIALSGCANDTDPIDPSSDSLMSKPGSNGAATVDDTSMPPWSVPTDVSARVAAAGLDLGPMGTAEHYHPQLRIIIDGADVPVPSNIGVDPATGAMSALHTHEGDGTIHIEADSVGEVFTLGQLFTQWGVDLTRQQIGGVRAEPGQQVQLTSNGADVTGDPAELRLEPNQQIILTLR